MLFNRNKISIHTLLLFTIFSFSEASLAASESVIIGFHKKPGKPEKTLIKSLGGKIRHAYGLLPAIAAEIPQQALDKLHKHPLVNYIEEDKTVISIDPPSSPLAIEIDSTVKSDEPVSSALAPGLFSVNSIAADLEYQNTWGVEHIGSKAVHDKNITGSGIKIAVLDTGIDYTHVDLDANYRGGYDFVYNDNDPFDDSWNSHGTHVAGIIAAEANGIGVVGVAPKASIYAVKVLDGSGFGTVSDIIAGFQWSVDNGMDIVNISIAGVDSKALQAACDAAHEAGLLIIAAAGNTYGQAALYPASFDSVIAVTGTDDMDVPGYFSPVDPVLEIAAPGSRIQSTAQDNTYAELSGTSQSIAMVSGTAALIMSSGISDINGDGEVNNLDVRQRLQISALDLGETGRDDQFGYGLVDAYKAITAPFALTIDMMKERRWRKSIERVSLENSLYHVSMQNDSLKGVMVWVLENNRFRKDLSTTYRFEDPNGISRNEILLDLDATDTALDIIFVPLGKIRTSAQITITK